MGSNLQNILDKAVEISKDFDGLSAIYSIDINQTKMQSKILSETHNKKIFLKYMKKMFLMIKDDDFEILVVDMSERIACKKIDDSSLIVLVADKNMSFGKIFAMIRSIN